MGGDHLDPGEYFDGISLLRAMEEIGHPFEEVGIPAYPEGHPMIPDAKLEEALSEKQPYAHHLATQMCFDAGAIRSFLSGARSRRIGLPALLGVPGVGGRMKLLEISARIGVGDSMRFLTKNARVVTRLLGPGRIRPRGVAGGPGRQSGGSPAGDRGAARLHLQPLRGHRGLATGVPGGPAVAAFSPDR